ncbi:alpha/beta hydrolase [Erythrobacter tepidarius]|uniref:alpha/beta hydrolase n=1 Tax=Erythrobacter tepidarius TaxID=60454 RepID=UPI000A39C4CD|nr:alpha/beta hydrolase [Erythrobacter tepidarius]
MRNTRPEPLARTYRVNDIDLVVHEWAPVPGSPDAPALVFAHATGFHGRVWDAVVEHFPGHAIHAIDLRGHGLSGGGPISDWRIMAHDVAQLLEQAGLSHAVGIGHSMGGHTLVQVAADRPGAFSRLVLFDPVILAPEFYALPEPLFTADNPHPAIRRKRDFASPEEMMARFLSRDPYRLFDARVFADYCRHGLVPAASGAGMELACSPEMEASVYGSSRSNGAILDAARTVDIPVLVVRAQMTDLQDFKSSPTWPELANVLPQGTDLYRPDRTHFHPFEDPADAARIIAGFIA